MTDMQTILTIIALLVAGLLFLTLEILTPMFGLLVALGLGAFGAAVWFCFTLSQVAGLVVLLSLIVIIPAYLTMLVKLLPKTPLGKRLFLGRPRSAEAEATPEADEHDAMVGREAVTETTLRPSGAIRIDGRRTIATAETGMIEQGTRVRVVRATGSNVVVREIKDT